MLTLYIFPTTIALIYIMEIVIPKKDKLNVIIALIPLLGSIIIPVLFFYISSYVSWNWSTFENTRDTVVQNKDATLKCARGVEKQASSYLNNQGIGTRGGEKTSFFFKSCM